MWILLSFLKLLLAALVITFTGQKMVKLTNRKYEKNYPPIYNSIKPKHPLHLMNNMLFEYGLMGNSFGERFRIDNTNNSEVRYTFFVLLGIPIIPTGCWRIKIIEHDGINKETEIKIYGTEKWNVSEIASIYITHWALVYAICVFLHMCFKLYRIVEDAIYVLP